MFERDDFSNLKAGDKIIISGRWEDTVHVVDKITPKGFIKINDATFYPDGTQRGSHDRWSFSSRLKHATPENIQKITEKSTIKKSILCMS